MNELLLKISDHNNFEQTVSEFQRMYSFLMKNHTAKQVEKFVRAYVACDATQERARVLFGTKAKFLTGDILILLDVAAGVSLRMAQRNEEDYYWLKRFGFVFMKIISLQQADILKSLQTVMNAQKSLNEKGIGHDGANVTNKAFVLIILNEFLKIQRLPTKSDIIEGFKRNGRTVDSGFYSKILKKLGLSGLPDSK
ncbi:hypothetical protein OAL55_03255 [Verrucomicrobiales bacterium]|nr:hypothetical protein [Verrucomicrobiales bacterium]